MSLAATMPEPAQAPSSRNLSPAGLIDRLDARRIALAAIALILPALIWRFTPGLSDGGRIVLAVFVAAMVGWTLTKLGDAVVAALAGLALVVSGVARPETLFQALGHELVWLLIAAFALAAVLKATGVATSAVALVAGRFRTQTGLFHGLTLAITATAFLVPSTSGRAALLLPVFLALADAPGDPRRVRALALLFPTAILLSAIGSLIGAGAHLVAIDFVAGLGGARPGYLGWLALGLPFALVTTHAATAIILHLFLDASERRGPLGATVAAAPTERRHLPALLILAATVVLFAAEPWHGVPLALVALAGAVLATLPGVSGVSLKSALKSVEWDLLIFMALTVMLGRALLDSDVDEWLMRHVVGFIGGDARPAPLLVAGVVALVATLSHLVVTSRTARALVLVPSLALPLAGLGFDPLAVALLIVAGTGFCQTTTASAKPVVMFAALDRPTFDAADLARLALWLYPVMLGALVAFALVVWPMAGVPLVKGG